MYRLITATIRSHFQRKLTVMILQTHHSRIQIFFRKLNNIIQLDKNISSLRKKN